MKKIFFKAFTLAEVLITLAIVGIVSAITIPSLVKNYKKKIYTTKILKVYSQLQDAVTAEIAEEHVKKFTFTKAGQVTSCTNGNNGICEAGLGYFLNKYFKVAKRDAACKKGTCFANSYKTPSGADAKTFANEPGNNYTRYCIQTVDGVTICGIVNTNGSNADFFIDINGLDEPNVTGYDAFVLVVSPDTNRVSDYSKDSSLCNTKHSSFNHIADYAAGCLNNIIENGNKITY